jgi:beta-glucosidase
MITPKFKLPKKLFVCFLFSLQVYSLAAQTASGNYSFPFQNPSLSFETRVNDLVSRFTLEEKVGQMLNAAPAIPRLGIPAYDWWNEVLHGVARTPFPGNSISAGYWHGGNI